ncbi:MAG: hypothetical protein JWO36_7372 [Myxococcales bacterium]|nr:hypothetical protein [Myxococcales bacterium]
MFDRLPSRRYSVSANRDDFYAWPELVGPVESSEPVILRMRLGSTLIVHAVADRAPLVGAKLILDEITATTDANGTATIRGLAPGSHDGWLHSAGYQSERVSLLVRQDPGGVVEKFVTLEHGARIEGVVVGPFGKPIPEASVWCQRAKDGSYVAAVMSTADGRWHLHASAGTYHLTAGTKALGRIAGRMLSCDGRTPQRNVVIRLGPTSAPYVLVALLRAGERLVRRGDRSRIAGVVVDERGRPASQVELRLVNTSARGSRWTGQSDARGRFDVDGLESGEYDIIADWSGPWFSRDEGARQRVRTGDTNIKRVRTGDTNIKLVLDAGSTVTGRVLLDGNPLPYYGLRLLAERDGPWGGMPIGVRSGDGRFTLRHVDPGRWRIALMGPGTRLVTSDEFTIAHGQTLDVGDIAMARGQPVHGYVRDQSGAAVAGARVIIGRPFGLTTRPSRLEQWFTGQYETTTNAEGAYTFDGIDTYGEHMRLPEIVWAKHFSAGVSVMRELPRGDATIDLLLIGCGRIAGIVQGFRAGHAIARARREDEPASARMSSVDQEGRFQFEDLPPGDYVISLDLHISMQVSPTNVTVVANQTATAMFEMQSSCVELTVKVPAGRSNDLLIESTVPGAKVGDGFRMTGLMRTEERCHFAFVQPGVYRISLDGKTWKRIVVRASPAEQTFDLR